VLDKKEGTIRFQARKGCTVDLDQLHESIWATRLGDGTGMELKWLEVTAVGEVIAGDKETLLKAPGGQQFLLGEDTTFKGGKSLKELREALARGEKLVSLSGRVDGWKGNLTRFTSTLPGKPRHILVRDFQTTKP